MQDIKRIENTISYLFIAGLFFSLAFVYFAQERLFYSTASSPAVLGPARFLRIFSVICIFLAVILSIFTSRKKYHHSVFIAFFALFATITLNYLISGANLDNNAELMSTRGIGTWFTLGLILTSYHNKRYAWFMRFTYLCVIVISLLTIYNFIDYGVGLWRGQALSMYRVYATNMVWIAPFVFLILKNNKKLKWLRISAIGMGIILALITQTRSFLIIYLFTFLFDFYHTKNKTTYILLLSLGLVGFVLLVLNSELLNNSLESLIKRGTNDTRSEQLNVFINQLKFYELITGKGHFATYGFGSKRWNAVDNQWLYVVWWAGIIPVLSYFYLAVILPAKMIFRGKLTYETKVECFMVILWSLGLLGLAIYTTFAIDLFFFIITIILGRLLYKYSNNIS